MTDRFQIAESPSGVGITAPADYVLISNGDGTWRVGPQSGGGGGVTSFNTRDGAVVPEFADYGTDLILNQATGSWEGSSLTSVLNNIKSAIDNVLPTVTSADNGKVLIVTAGAWDKGFQFPIQWFSTIIDDPNFGIDSPPGTVISSILPAGLYSVSISVYNVNSNTAGEFSIQFGMVSAPGTVVKTVVPSQLTTGGGPNTVHEGTVVLESNGTDGLYFAQTEITPLVGTSEMRFNIVATRLK